MPQMYTFNGTLDRWQGFISNFKFNAKRYRWPDKVRLENLRSCLRDKAVEFVNKRPKHVRSDYRKVLKDLGRRYSLKEPASSVSRSLFVVRQEEQESIEEFADRVYALTLDGYPHVPDDVMQALAINHFLRGCKDKQAALLTNMDPPKSVMRALKKAKDHANNLKTFTGNKAIRRVMFKEESDTRPSASILKTEFKRNFRPTSLPPVRPRNMTQGPEITAKSTTTTETERNITAMIEEAIRKSFVTEMQKVY